ncbi:hypothetical protein V1264_023990 [Littorina saxatilis]|uniref:DUF7869 domain-containing protein n=1 Tax=Littorina saxatilis TaxID=31220 RepID=A0AAN9BAR3_9CAEN
MDWGQRKTYVASLVDFVPTKQQGKPGTRRRGTLTYHLRIRGDKIQVCKAMFQNTLDIGEWSVRNWVTTSHEVHGMLKSPSTRTQHPNTAAAKEDKVQTARNFLESLAKLPSHYCRKQSQKMYLETVIESRTKLNALFQQYCDDNGKQRVSRQVLIREMKDMNIAIHKPKKDECNVCCAYKYGNIPEHEYQVHIQRKNEARKEKTMDKRIAEENGDVQVLIMDLQVVLLAPRIYANANYFKTKLCCHNFTLYNMSDKEVACYFWNESEGEVKSNNFTSCIVDYLESTVDETTNTIIIYSDSCGYQNRNVTLGNALLHFAVRQGKVVIQKFLEKGHTWMEVDSVNSAIENKLRRRQIFWPAEYVEVITSARESQPYKVVQVDHTFFKDFSDLRYYKSIRPGTASGDPQVVDIRCLKYLPDGTVHNKLHYSDEWQPLPQRRRRAHGDPGVINQLYRARLPIKDTKWQHLQQLKEVLPADYHHYYDGLPHGR